MSDKADSYERWMTGSSDASRERAVQDQRRLNQGKLRAGDAPTYTRAGFSRSCCDQLRRDRDDLDYREWMSDTGFSGLGRRHQGPGVQTEGQVRRRERMRELDEGF